MTVTGTSTLCTTESGNGLKCSLLFQRMTRRQTCRTSSSLTFCTVSSGTKGGAAPNRPALRKKGTPRAGRQPPLAGFSCQRAPTCGADAAWTLTAQASHRSRGASPEAAAPCRSCGAPPKLRCLTEAQKAHRSRGASPQLRCRAEAADRHRSFGVSPQPRRHTAAAAARRACDARPILKRASAAAAPRRSSGVPPQLRRRSASCERRRKDKKGGVRTRRTPRMDVRIQR